MALIRSSRASSKEACGKNGSIMTGDPCFYTAPIYRYPRGGPLLRDKRIRRKRAAAGPTRWIRARFPCCIQLLRCWRFDGLFPGVRFHPLRVQLLNHLKHRFGKMLLGVGPTNVLEPGF